VRGVPAKKVSLNAYQDRKHTHWARKAGSPRPVGNVDRIPTRTDVVRPKTFLQNKNNLN